MAVSVVNCNVKMSSDEWDISIKWTRVHIVDIYGIVGTYSSGTKSRQKAQKWPNGDHSSTLAGSKIVLN